MPVPSDNTRMAGPCRLVVVALLGALAAAAHAQEPPLPDPQAFLAQTLRNLRSNDMVRSAYTYQEQETRYSYGPDRKVTRKRDADQRRKERDWLARRELEGLDERQARERKREIEEMKERTVKVV